jgi:hypothetical protein
MRRDEGCDDIECPRVFYFCVFHFSTSAFSFIYFFFAFFSVNTRGRTQSLRPLSLSLSL